MSVRSYHEITCGRMDLTLKNRYNVLVHILNETSSLLMLLCALNFQLKSHIYVNTSFKKALQYIITFNKY